MKLDSYLRAHNLTSAQFGEVSGIGSKQAVHKYRHGLRFPTPENLRRIREATNGAVTADDFVDQHAGASPPFVVSGKPPAPPPKPKTKRSASTPAAATPPAREKAA